MNDVAKLIGEMIKDLKRERDELQVKLHLAKMEASDEWTELQVKLTKLDSKAKELGGVTAQASEDIGAAAKLLVEEISSGFKRIAKKL